jgi:hypothetical protein
VARTSRPHQLPRLLALGLAGAALATAGCAPITTQQTYSPSDGVLVAIGEEVRASNLLILTSGEGEPGALVGALTNRTDQPTLVTVTVGAESVDIPVDPGATVLLNAPDAPEADRLAVEQVTLQSVPAPPGAVADVELSTPSAGSVTVSVPVLDGTLEPYGELVPGGEPTDAGGLEGAGEGEGSGSGGEQTSGEDTGGSETGGEETGGEEGQAPTSQDAGNAPEE